MNDKRAKTAVFLDRDGTINIDKGYFYRPEECEFEEGSIEAIGLLNQAGYKVFVISNQAGIALGHFNEAQVDELHNWIQAELLKHVAHIDGFYYCPHHAKLGIGQYKTTCDCRKPAPGLLVKAAKEWNIDLANSYMVGDHNSDVEAGRAAGVQSIFVRTGHGSHEEAFVAAEVPRAANLYEAVKKYILA
ncbi:MAG: D-glycero-beta-D-manno-heptose 1,7-bisphosphate 7-phosphatase [Pelosinus sp.]|nr:D-glycero-beta-D-manno-heptose 1,7-bisphosphate 7-phosphatase [Pelosinus sp.]